MHKQGKVTLEITSDIFDFDKRNARDKAYRMNSPVQETVYDIYDCGII